MPYLKDYHGEIRRKRTLINVLRNEESFNERGRNGVSVSASHNLSLDEVGFLLSHCLMLVAASK